MLVVDTSVWVDYFNGVKNPQTDFLDTVLDKTPIIIGDLILAEVLQGFRYDPDFEKVRRTLGKFMQVSMVSPALAVQSDPSIREKAHFGGVVANPQERTCECRADRNHHPVLCIQLYSRGRSQ